MKYICSKNVLIGSEFIKASIGYEDGTIKSIDEYPKGENYYDSYIIPGLIEVHSHGGYGFDIITSSKENLKDWLNMLPQEATTSIVLTTYSSSVSKMNQSVEMVKSAMNEKYPVSILGIHLEGPFISCDYLGAMKYEAVLKPSIEKYKDIVGLNEDIIKIVTLAPEMDKDYVLMDYLNSKNVKISCGHSGLSYSDAIDALNHGLKAFTHTFNAMKGLHHRDVGTVGASLLLDDCYSECILDGKHVCFEALKILFRTKPKDKILFVTDSLNIKGFEDGIYDFDKQLIEIKEKAGYIAGTNKLTGSTLSMLDCVRNAYHYCDISLVNAINASSLNQAKYLGIEDKKGSISLGSDFDICILDKNLNLLKTYFNGKEVYSLK